MTCWPPGGCGHEFCWICLGTWSTHDNSGGYYKCNVYESKTNKEDIDSLTAAEREKQEIQKYGFYYEWYLNHMTSIKLIDKL